MGHRRHELLGAHAGGDRTPVDAASTEAPDQPRRRRLAHGALPADAGYPAPSRMWPAPRPPRVAVGHTACRWSSRPSRRAARRPAWPARRGGRRDTAAEAERHGAATNSAKRARPTSSSTTSRVAASSPSRWPTTSPSRCTRPARRRATRAQRAGPPGPSPAAGRPRPATGRRCPRRCGPTSAPHPACVRANALASSGAAVGLVHDHAARARRRRRSRPALADGHHLRLGVAAVPSTTWTIRSASRTESSVERNASTSSCGSLRTKPTVSVTRTVSPPGARAAGCEGRASRRDGSPPGPRRRSSG